MEAKIPSRQSNDLAFEMIELGWSKGNDTSVKDAINVSLSICSGANQKFVASGDWPDFIAWELVKASLEIRFWKQVMITFVERMLDCLK